MPSENLSAPEIWAKTVDQVKHRVNNRSLWEALEKAVGITIEDGILIVGMRAGFFSEAGHMTTSEHKNAIERAASELAGQPLRMRIIEGEAFDDWLFTKKRDERVAASREATYERRDREESATQSWDGLYEHAARAYSATQFRQLPQSKARYLTDMLYVLSDALAQLGNDELDEQNQRLMARVIDRVAGNAEVPSTMVAMELERLRAWQKQSAMVENHHLG
jgi:hypothetical protein